MDLGLEGRRALVTGGSGGIGAAVVERLAAEGCDVVAHGRRAAPAEVVAEAVLAAGGTVSVVLGDLTDAAAAEAVCAAAQKGGPIDVLVANAGPFGEHGLFTATDADWLDAFEGNVLSAVRCVRHLACPMRERGWGRIVTIGTRATTTPLPHMVEYSAAKAALLNATGALAAELAGSGVTANTVSAGVVATDGLREMFLARARREGDERSWEQLEAEVAGDYAPNPVGRLGRPEDVADAVAFLASDRAGTSRARRCVSTVASPAPWVPEARRRLGTARLGCDRAGPGVVWSSAPRP